MSASRLVARSRAVLCTYPFASHVAFPVVLLSILTACSSAAHVAFFGATPTSAAAGEWIDEKKSTPTDTMVWVLAADGDDALLTIHVDGGGRRASRKHYGRWSEGRASDANGGSVPALCFVRRPGRDAPSCDRFTVDSVRTADGMRRRLTVRGYAGAHHSGDRELIERRSAPVSAAAAPAAAAPEAGGGGGGGYHPTSVQPERPSVATHAGTIAAGFWELETGLERDHASDGTFASQLPTLLKLGLGKRTQLAVTLPTSGGTGVPPGVGDISVGIKWRLVEDRPLLQDIALLPSIKLATGGPRGTGTTDISLLLINSRTFGPVGVDLNVGGTWRSGDGTQAPRTASMWAIAAGIPIQGNLGWALETFGLPGTGGPAGASPIVALLTGPTYVVRPEVALDVGIITPLVGPQAHAFYVGLVTSLGRLLPASLVTR
jgi:hypothetical protein